MSFKGKFIVINACFTSDGSLTKRTKHLTANMEKIGEELKGRREVDKSRN